MSHPITPPSGSERVLFVHAHPDDESIATGGTIAALLDRGAAVTVLTCTRGECGEIIPADLQHLAGHPLAIAAHRETEIAHAMSILGVTDHRFLGDTGSRMVGRDARRYVDSGMAWGEHGPVPLADLPADALCSADPGEVAADIATVIAGVGATVVVSYDDYGGYGHPDHIAVHEASRRAAEVLSVPFIEIHRGEVRRGDIVVDVSSQFDRKSAALRAYRSQLTIDGERMIAPGGQVEQITRTEVFRPAAGDSPVILPWIEYGLRGKLAGSAIALAAGVAVGAVATVSHQSSVLLFGVGIPVGIIVALLAVTALLVGLRVLFDTRIVAGSAAVGILGVIALLSLESQGGSILIPATPVAYYWIYGPVLVAALVLAWPRIVRPTRDKIEATTEPKGPPAP